MKAFLLVLIFPLITIMNVNIPGLNADESFFFRQSLLDSPGLKTYFALPYAGMLKQVMADQWFSFLDRGQRWEPWMIRLPWILIWTAGITLHAAAAKRLLGARVMLLFLLIAVAHPDISWSARADIGENSISVVLLGFLFYWMANPQSMVLPVAALWLAGWNRLNFYWAAYPILALGPSNVTKKKRTLLLCAGTVGAGFLVWNSRTVGSSFLSLPWNTSLPFAIFSHFLHAFAGRMAAVNVFHSAHIQEARVIGLIVVSMLAATSVWLLIRQPKTHGPILRYLGTCLGVAFFHSFYTGMLGYWHVAYLLPIFFVGIAWLIDQLWQHHPRIGASLFFLALISSLSGWTSSQGDHNLLRMQTKFSVFTKEIISFCENKRCAAADIGIYDNLITARPRRGVADLAFQGVPPPQLAEGILKEIELHPDTWFAFWSINRHDIPHTIRTHFDLWSRFGLERTNQITIDDTQGVPVFVLFQLAKAKSR